MWHPRTRRGLGFGAGGVDLEDSGEPLCSSLDHLLLEPLHLRRADGNTCGDISSQSGALQLVYGGQVALLMLSPSETIYTCGSWRKE